MNTDKPLPESPPTADGPAPERAVRNLCRIYGLRARINRRRGTWQVFRDGKQLGFTTTDRTLSSWVSTFAQKHREGVI